MLVGEGRVALADALAGREQARGRIRKHERRRAKAICVWNKGVRQLGHVGAICYSSSRLRRQLPRLLDLLAICDEAERLARGVVSTAAPVVSTRLSCVRGKALR